MKIKILLLVLVGLLFTAALGIDDSHFRLTASAHPATVAHKKVQVSTTKVKAKPNPAKPAIQPAATPQVAAVSTPVKTTPVSHPAVPAKVATGTSPQPVVTPSPSSSVSSLTPTAPTTPTPTNPSSSSQPSTPTTTSYTSTNWSGYLAANSSYNAVSGSWILPAVTGNGVSTSADAAWIGIGGVTSSDLIQIGTQDTISASGTVTTGAFYEMLPAASQTVPGLTVSAGDSMSASIVENSGGVWTMSITDNTTSQTYSKVVSYTSTNSSAEWIEEDPSYSNGHQITFVNFDTVNFTGATTTNISGIVNLNSGSAQPVTMVSRSGQPVATPSAIGSDGASFSVSHD